MVTDSVHGYSVRLLDKPVEQYNAKKEELKNLLEPGVQIQAVNLDMDPEVVVARGELVNMINFVNGLNSIELVTFAKAQVEYIFFIDWFEEFGVPNVPGDFPENVVDGIVPGVVGNGMNVQGGGYRRKTHRKSRRSHRKSRRSNRKSRRSH